MSKVSLGKFLGSHSVSMDLISGWADNEGRNISWIFGEKALSEFCKRMKIDLVIRAHEVWYWLFIQKAVSGKLGLSGNKDWRRCVRFKAKVDHRLLSAQLLRS